MDPLNKFQDMSKVHIMNNLGYVPSWAGNIEYKDLPLKDALEIQYQPLYEIKGGIVDENGIYKFPGDPELYPLIKLTRNDEILYQYIFGMVSIVQEDGSSYVTRMD